MWCNTTTTSRGLTWPGLVLVAAVRMRNLFASERVGFDTWQREAPESWLCAGLRTTTNTNPACWVFRKTANQPARQAAGKQMYRERVSGGRRWMAQRAPLLGTSISMYRARLLGPHFRRVDITVLQGLASRKDNRPWIRAEQLQHSSVSILSISRIG
jgi:hypothetical protein